MLSRWPPQLAAPLQGRRAERVARSCARYSVPALIAQEVVGLREGQRCRARFERQYGRYGFDCRLGALTATWRRLARPLHIPSLASGAACPVSGLAPGIDFRSSGVGPGIGTDPAYPAPFSPDATQPLNDFTVPPGWQGGKHAFFTLPKYDGPVLVRSGQLDGSGVVTLASNEIRGAPNPTNPKPELRFPARGPKVAHTLFFLTPRAASPTSSTERRSARSSSRSACPAHLSWVDLWSGCSVEGSRTRGRPVAWGRTVPCPFLASAEHEHGGPGPSLEWRGVMLVRL